MTPLVQRLFGDSASAHYSKSLLDALDAALQANPAARPQSVAEFRAVLGAEPAPIAPPHEGGLRAANCLPVRTAPRAEPDFEIGGILPPPTTAPISTVPVEAPTAAAQITLFRPPRSRRGALWAGGALMLLLAAGTYGWRTIDQSVRVELPASVVSAVATDTPMAATPTPTPAAEKATTRVAPAVSAPTPVLAAPPKKAAATASPASPRDGCAGRTQFALYRCMQAQCAQRGLARHPQCEHLRSTDSVD